MALATTDDLAAFLRREIDENDPGAMAALEAASAFVEAYIGQPVAVVEDEDILIDGSGTRVILLPAFPVTDVAEVKIDDETVNPDEYEWSKTGELRRVNGIWPSALRSVEVTYTHGWETVPAGIVSVVAAMAARQYEAPAGVRQEAMGSYSVTYAGNGLTLQAAEAVILDSYRRGR
jgi:hypothetical protein